MSNSPKAAGPARINNLAMAFQEAFTAILRTRYQTQRVEDAEQFRSVMRKMIATAVNESRALGYSDDISKMALYAIIGFLDESVLNSRDPVFANWSKKPLQEEMFGGHVAGEYFFCNVSYLLNRQGSAEVADVLELHALCLLLGYRGRFAVGDATEIHAILWRIRSKIGLIRGPSELFSPKQASLAPPVSRRDPWVRRLTIAALAAVAITLLAYLGYIFLLGRSVTGTEQSDFVGGSCAPGPMAVARLEKQA